MTKPETPVYKGAPFGETALKARPSLENPVPEGACPVMFKASKKAQLASFVAALITILPATALAQAEAAAAANKFDIQAAAAIAAGLAIGIAVLGGGLGQGRAVAAALEGISRNPGAAARIQTPMILGLALIESLVLFAFAIAFILWQKISFLSPGGSRFEICREESELQRARGRFALCARRRVCRSAGRGEERASRRGD